MITWEKHYTGSSYASLFGGRLDLSKTEDGRFDLIRVDLRLPYARYCKLFGVFLHRTNSLSFTHGGTEVWGPNFQIAWLRPLDWELRGSSFFSSKWNPHWTNFSVKAGRLAFGFTAPAWLQRRKDRQEAERWKEMADDYQADHNDQAYQDHLAEEEETFRRHP